MTLKCNPERGFPPPFYPSAERFIKAPIYVQTIYLKSVDELFHFRDALVKLRPGSFIGFVISLGV